MKRRALFLMRRQREARSSLKRLGVPVEVLAATKQCTVFAPPAGFTLPELVQVLWGSLYEVTSDDQGFRVQFHDPGDPVNEVALSIVTGKKFSSSEASDIFLGVAGPLERRASTVAALLAEPVRRRDELLQRGELLARMGLPVVELPADVATGSRSKQVPAATRSPALSSRPNGRMIHLPMTAADLRRAFDGYRVDAELIASNASWCSFVPRGSGFRIDQFVEEIAVRCAALALSWDDEFGLQLDLHQPGTSGGFRVQVRLGHRFHEGALERTFFGQLEFMGARGRAAMQRRVARVRDALQEPIDARDEWLRAGGLEKLLGLPTSAVAPLPGLRLKAGTGRLLFGQDRVIPQPS